MDNRQLAPYAESYAPTEPAFQFTPTQREIDFAQLVASGAAPVEALIACDIVPEEEANNTPRPLLYRMATRLLTSEAVQERIDYYRQLHNHNISVTADRLRQEAAAIAFADFAHTHTHDGRPITNPHEIPRHIRAAIKEWYIDKDGVVRIKFHDKKWAMQMAGDLEGHFDEANRAKAPQVTVNLAQQVNHTPQSQPPLTSSGDPLPDHSPLHAAVVPEAKIHKTAVTMTTTTSTGSGSLELVSDKSSSEVPECLR
jgi:hypothetical protein